MSVRSLDREGSQIVLHAEGAVCTGAAELLTSRAFEKVVRFHVASLREQGSPLLEVIAPNDDGARLASLLRALADSPIDRVARIVPGMADLPNRRQLLHRLVEELYDYWRRFNRFMVCHSENTGPDGGDRRPYRTFNSTMERLTDVVRAAYRDICENITADHPRVFRQVAAGCQVGLIAVPKPWTVPAGCEVLEGLPFVRQVLIHPPLLLDPPTNKRTGQFQRIDKNPLVGMKLEREKWMCYPACVGPLTIFIYFHQRFMGLATALANLFELARDEQIAAGPDAVYVYGAPSESLARFGDLPTVFYDDPDSDLLVGAVPAEDRFGYFGYLKKMTLTLHNIVMMKRGRMPFHGAMSRICLKNGAAANLLLIGDTATGKSETLEALRIMAGQHIRDLRIVADDMGSLQVADDGRVLGYGTEVGAFIRLDDLQQGYAFGQIDRAIIMSPQKVNARVVLPVTTLDEVLAGHPVDILLYANNYEQVDEDHPILERLPDAEKALETFRHGAAMAKGTTSATGLVHSYFANIFGPPQYREVHEKLAREVFAAAFEQGVFVAQMRTRLGVPGCEASGPQEAAAALLEQISRSAAARQNEPAPQAAST
ncbi:MAG: hypothetical protein BIFFINMI_03633 [Phycisphaerae bacterium]|nr:hypothetical protein [Phycisphaerae bacterium]